MNSISTFELLNTQVNLNFPCVYLLLDDHEKVLYVGSTKNLRSRVYSHFKLGKVFSKVLYEKCEDYEMLSIELDKIIEFKPPLNKDLPSSHKYIRKTEIEKRVSRIIRDAIMRMEPDQTNKGLNVKNPTYMFRKDRAEAFYEAIEKCIDDILPEIKNKHDKQNT